jgi:hypothetical protein
MKRFIFFVAIILNSFFNFFNLEAQDFFYPQNSKIVIYAYGGCETEQILRLEVIQKNDNINLVYFKTNEGRLEAEIPQEDYKIFWQKFESLKPMDLNNEYSGEFIHTGMFSGVIRIEYIKNNQKFQKTVKFKALKGIKEKEFNEIYNLILNLKKYGNRISLEKLIQYLKEGKRYKRYSNDYEYYYTALWQIPGTKDTRFVNDFIQILEGDYSFEIKIPCIRALGNIKDPKALPILKKLAKEYPPQTDSLYCIYLLESIAEISGKGAISFLEDFLDEKYHYGVRDYARRKIMELKQ